MLEYEAEMKFTRTVLSAIDSAFDKSKARICSSSGNGWEVVVAIVVV